MKKTKCMKSFLRPVRILKIKLFRTKLGTAIRIWIGRRTKRLDQLMGRTRYGRKVKAKFRLPIIRALINFTFSVMMFVPFPGTVDIPLATIISIVLVWAALEMVIESFIWFIKKLKKE
ncbi:MAG: hypothetical protein LBU27_09715 [Candidatus Peribacteria bacterium]|nr:hypothetical protein [Candidatus Peribacteria bacterium]